MDNFLSDMCRTCMIQFSKTNKNIDNKKQNIHEVPTGCKNNTSIMELLQILQPQIKLGIKDCLPTLICSACVQKLLVSYEFIEMYKKVDTKFHNMLKEIDATNMCYDDESLELNEEEILENESNSFEITKFEIEQITIEGYEKEEENLNECPDFEDEPFQEVEDKETTFNSPYSDASDNEWTPDQICEKTSSVTNFISNKIPKKIKSKKRKEKEEDHGLPIENSDGSVSCQQCKSVLENVKNWQKHMRQHRLEKVPKRNYTKKLNKTRKHQSNEKVFECEHCGKGFPKISYYRSHMRVHTDAEPYLCIECGKSFKTVSSLNAHMLRHKGEKNVQCPHCPKKFVSSSGLYGHMMVHRKDKPYVCDICGSAFHMAYQLRKHNLYHNGIKNYQCEYCDMRFVTREKQRRHMRTHTGEKPYRCKYCDRAFAQSNDCVKHLRQHLGENVYQCDLCPLRFPLARDLRTHFATHKDDDEETRVRNLEARGEEERNLQIKLALKNID